MPRDLVTIVHKAIERPTGRPLSDRRGWLPTCGDSSTTSRSTPSSFPTERFLRLAAQSAVAGLIAVVAILLVSVTVVSLIAPCVPVPVTTLAVKKANVQPDAGRDAQESRQRLVRLHVANGERLLDEGDLLEWAPWLTGSTRRGRAAGGDRGLASPRFWRSPRLAQLWCHEQEVSMRRSARTADESSRQAGLHGTCVGRHDRRSITARFGTGISSGRLRSVRTADV